MPNTSATGGFLRPSLAPPVLEGNALADFFQNWMVGITDLAGIEVRPRWQPDPPNMPDEGVTWIAFGIVKTTSDTFAVELHYPDAGGYNQLRRHEVIDLMLSAYGPEGAKIAAELRDGMQIAQNREILTRNNMGLVSSGDVSATPELYKERWLQRYDLPFSIRRQVVRNYMVLNLASAHGILDNEHYLTPIEVVEP